jgi:ATP-binding cassette subfamily F protein 3
VSKYFSSEPVLDAVALEIRHGDHCSLVGPNGAGKTTLLRILAGQLEPDRGGVEVATASRIGYLAQRLDLDPQATVWDTAREGLAERIQLAEEAIALAERLSQESDDVRRQQLATEYERTHARLEQLDAYQVEHRIERVLDGLGLAAPVYSAPAGQLSGGQQHRLALARLLLAEPDLLLLDEPSNHLDLAATQWLEQFLAESASAHIVVSHDRYFLDRVSTTTLELVDGRVDSFPGNFSKYQTLKAQRLEVERRTFERQQAEIERLEDFVRRHHYGQKHAQAEDRRKKLARIERVAQPREIATPRFAFAAPARSGDLVLRADAISKSYANRLFGNLTFQIQRGERWGIVGVNGSGKTTLLRCALGQVPVDTGSIELGHGVVVGYLDQQLALVDPAATALEAVRDTASQLEIQARHDLLGRFGISGDAASQVVSSLSGGQRARLALARLAADRPNFLVLDEPTNHLDLWARGALEAALREFAGTIFVVSHDRFFLNQVCDHLLVFDDQRVHIITGNYDDYRAWSREGGTSPSTASASASAAARSRPARPRRPKRQFPYRKVEDIEADIAAREAEIERLHQSLADPAVLRDGAQVKQAQTTLAKLHDDLQTLYAHWEEASELN